MKKKLSIRRRPKNLKGKNTTIYLKTNPENKGLFRVVNFITPEILNYFEYTDNILFTLEKDSKGNDELRPSNTRLKKDDIVLGLEESIFKENFLFGIKTITPFYHKILANKSIGFVSSRMLEKIRNE